MAMNRRARRALGRKSSQEAAALGKHQMQASDPAAILHASHRLFAMGRAKEALAPLSKAVAAHPGNVSLRDALAYALAAIDDLPAAIEQYSILVQQRPDSAPFLTNLALVLIRSGQRGPARGLLERATELDPENPNAAYTLAQFLNDNREVEEAHRHYRRAVRLFPKKIGAKPGPDKATLRPSGWFGFTTETFAGEGFHLEPTGRYGHSRSYVEATAAKFGFEVAQHASVIARYQSGQPVEEDLFVIRPK
jgi:tetratricopeptide (TPR) repeat protein